MRLTIDEAKEKYPGVFFLGELFWIGQYARVGQGAVVEQGAVVGQDARVGQGAVVAVLINKYICNISPLKNAVNIRIGCELHTIPEWEAQKEIIADRNDRKWWDESGRYIYEFLKGEAERYTTKYHKS